MRKLKTAFLWHLRIHVRYAPASIRLTSRSPPQRDGITMPHGIRIQHGITVKPQVCACGMVSPSWSLRAACIPPHGLRASSTRIGRSRLVTDTSLSSAAVSLCVFSHERRPTHR